ncbi:CCCH-type zinc finger-containing protein [Tieghemostelium lacteum]|uniref:CCCH-type zinc finger-containing protein n=1 Tax=Tieghemostelium lacteum TaxID=361077 RepID=A0A152A288_TIELA|nr:CCCH-type zinc finger-containing protein [Tieghemostelium lacteum]|eukprot:KYR00336.1 CCCH-type zinc finger-containing protein [Tieghemostelium lacteum]
MNSKALTALQQYNIYTGKTDEDKSNLVTLINSSNQLSNINNHADLGLNFEKILIELINTSVQPTTTTTTTTGTQAAKSISRLSTNEFNKTGISSQSFFPYMVAKNYTVKYNWARDPSKEEKHYDQIIKTIFEPWCNPIGCKYIKTSSSNTLLLDDINIIGKSDVLIIPKDNKDSNALVSFELKKETFISKEQRQLYAQHICQQDASEYLILTIGTDLDEYWEIVWSPSKTSLVVNTCRINDTDSIKEAITLTIYHTFNTEYQQKSLTELFIEHQIIQNVPGEIVKDILNKVDRISGDEEFHEKKKPKKEPPAKKQTAKKQTAKKQATTKQVSKTKNLTQNNVSDIAQLEDLEYFTPTKSDYLKFRVAQELQKIKLLDEYQKRKSFKSLIQ